MRPLNLGEILDRTVQFYRSRFLVLLGISVIPTGTALVIASGVFFFFAWWGVNGAASASKAMAGVLAVLFLCAAGLIAVPILLAVTALAAAAMNHAVNQVWQGGQITIRDAYKAIWPRGWRYIWLYLLQAVFIWIAPIAVWIVLVSVSAGLAALLGGGNAAAGVDVLIGMLAILSVAALAGYALWMLLRLCLAFPACVVEQTTAWASLKRSSVLSKGTRGRIFVLFLLGTVISYILSGAVMLLTGIVMALIPGSSTPQHARATGMIVIFSYYAAAFVVQALARPVYGVALMLFYYDQRIRQEGFDIEWMMQQAGLVVPAPAQVEAEAPAAASEPLPEPPPLPDQGAAPLGKEADVEAL
jgi:hypothetical protein